MSKLPAGLYFTILPEEYVEDAYELEASGYPADEAASLETLRYRQEKAPELFIGAFLASTTRAGKSVLVGFVSSTGTFSPLVSHASLTTHVPTASTIAVHSVCVAQTHRRLGIATALLREYARRGRDGVLGSAANRLALLTHQTLQPLYERAGFKLVGTSSVQHGKEKWYDMILDLHPGSPVRPVQAYDPAPTPEPAPQTPFGQADILAALNAPRPRAAKPKFWEGLGRADVLDGEGKNKEKLVCLRPGCGSVILQPGIAALKESSDESFYAIDPHRPAPHYRVLSRETPWWLVTPSPMAFDNVAFSRAVPNSSSSSSPNSSEPPRPRKLLACAECDLGPVGWCFEGQGVTQFWVNAARVGYR